MHYIREVITMTDYVKHEEDEPNLIATLMPSAS